MFDWRKSSGKKKEFSNAEWVEDTVPDELGPSKVSELVYKVLLKQ